MTRVLVTGATGFVGSACVRRFVDEGAEVHACARARSPGLPAEVTFHEVDLLDAHAATELVAQRAPDLRLVGPIQYDAAIDPVVGKAKLPGSDVAGRATVFVFPDLNTGNNTYKAVQRSAHAVAIGPVLQGLRKPVNDLSRGALVEDIVNTVAITAVQAQGNSTPHTDTPAGAASGAIAGALTDVGVNDRFMKELATEDLKPSEAVLFVLVRKVTGDKVLEGLKGVGGRVLQTSLDHTREEALRKALAGEAAAAAAS